MSEIGKISLAPPGSQQRVWQEKILSITRTPATDKEIHRRWEIARATFFAQMDNSSGLEGATTLRHFLNEINSRLFEHGLHSLPASFNVFEAFVEYLPTINVFQMLPELEHRVHFGDYFDYLTSSASIDVSSISSSITENFIYSFDATDDFESSIFHISESIRYAFKSISYVRRGQELSIVARVGIDDADNPKVSPISKILFTKEGIRPNSDVPHEAIFDYGVYQKSVLLFRVDLEDSSQNTRYVLRDEGNSFNLFTDDIAAFLDSKGQLSEASKKHLDIWSKETNKYQEIFEICLSLMGLEIFVTEHTEEIIVERRPTKYKENFRKNVYQKLTSSAPSGEKKFFRDIGTLKLGANNVRGRVVIQNPRFRVERSGYWKRLDPEQNGQDKHGNLVKGKTWVVQTSFMYADTPKSLEGEAVDNLGDAGYIYILRNAAHETNVFKIGLTKRSPEIRAAELSSTTASPDKFLVAQDWFTRDCALAEATIHQYFDSYRLNDRREFFRVEFRELITVIDEIVKKINNS
jgi:hypothetical protein